MLELTWMNQAVLAVATLAVTVLSTAIGFGSAVILIPVFALVLPIKKAIALLSVYFICVTVTRAWLFRQHIDWDVVKRISVGAVPACLVGIALMVWIRPEYVQRALAIVILLFLVNELTGFTSKRPMRLGRTGTMAVGTGYGFFNGLVGTGNPITAAFLLHMGMQKEAFVANMAACSILLDVLKTVILAQQGWIQAGDSALLTVLVAIGLIGTWLGRHLVHQIPVHVFKRLVFAMLAVVAGKMLL